MNKVGKNRTALNDPSEDIKLMYIWILKHKWTAKVERIKNGIYGIALYKDLLGNFNSGESAWTDRGVFYLYPIQ